MSGQPEFRAHRWLSKDGLNLYSRVYDAALSGRPARRIRPIFVGRNA